MTSTEHRQHARNYLSKAEDYLVSAEANMMARSTPAAGDAVHAGISSKDAIVTALTGATGRSKDHGAAARELREGLGQRSESAAAERALRELLSAKAEIEYSSA